MDDLTKDDLNAIRWLLRYSWKDVNYEYDGLTEEERDGLDRDTHARLVKWVLKEEGG